MTLPGLLLMADPSALTAYLEEAVRQGNIPGAVVMIRHHGRTVYEHAAGFADLETRRALRMDDIFMMASMAKPVSATAILTLVDAKQLSLDDPVKKFFPQFSGTSNVRQLLSHTSGIFGNTPGEPRVQLIRDFGLTLAEAVDGIVRGPLAYEPGTRYVYGGASFCVAGRIAEIITGEDFDRFTSRVLFEPLGMNETVFRTPENLSARIPKIYQRKAGRWTSIPSIVDRPGQRGPRPGGLVLVSGGLYSTAASMLAFAQLHLDGGRTILSRQSIDEMRRRQTPAGMESYGLGWQLLPGGAISHGGAYGTLLYVDPARNAAAAVLTQTVGAARFQAAVRKKIQEFLRDSP